MRPLLVITLLFSLPTWAAGYGAPSTPGRGDCYMPGGTLSGNVAVLAAFANGGRPLPYPIDKSGHTATLVNVAVNSPDRPVALMLGAYEPTIWNISWSKNTVIQAVLVNGRLKQALAGLDADVPRLINFIEERPKCSGFLVDSSQLDSLAKRFLGRGVEMTFTVNNGDVIIGKPLPPDTLLFNNSRITPESFRDRSAANAAQNGLESALNWGVIRRATASDAQAWQDAALRRYREIPYPIPGRTAPQRPSIANAYVVLRAFRLPDNLSGNSTATFFIPQGTPRPTGNFGQSTLYDFETLSCQGPLCKQP